MSQQDQIFACRGHTEKASAAHMKAGGNEWDTVMSLHKWFKHLDRVLLIDDLADKARFLASCCLTFAHNNTTCSRHAERSVFTAGPASITKECAQDVQPCSSDLYTPFMYCMYSTLCASSIKYSHCMACVRMLVSQHHQTLPNREAFVACSLCAWPRFSPIPISRSLFHSPPDSLPDLLTP